VKLSDVAREVIELAEAINSYQETELPKRHPRYPFVDPSEGSDPPPAEQKRLQDLLLSLPDEAVYELLLIMQLGRGDFGTDDLTGHYQAIRKMFRQKELAISEMTEKASLADYLLDGLAELGRSGIHLEQLTPVPSAS